MDRRLRVGDQPWRVGRVARGCWDPSPSTVGVVEPGAARLGAWAKRTRARVARVLHTPGAPAKTALGARRQDEGWLFVRRKGVIIRAFDHQQHRIDGCVM